MLLMKIENQSIYFINSFELIFVTSGGKKIRLHKLQR